MTGDRMVSGLTLPLWEEFLWPLLDAWDSVRLRTTSSQRALWRALLFLLKKEPMFLRELVRCGPSIPVEAVKACAFIGLHMMIGEKSGRSENGSSVSSSSLD